MEPKQVCKVLLFRGWLAVVIELARASDGSNSDANGAMIAMTTSNLMRVKPAIGLILAKDLIAVNSKSSEHILFTGGTGFFGRSLLRCWLKSYVAGIVYPTVTILTRSSQGFLACYPEFADQPWLSFHNGDICEPGTLPQDGSFTHILHAAADSTLGSQLNPLQRYDQIVSGTRNILDLAVSRGAKRFLFVSSGAVYGPQPFHLDRIPEDWNGIPDPLNPRNAYGIAKRTAEHLCALYGQKFALEFVIARCFAFVGPDLPLDVHFAIGNFIRDALWHDEIIVNGDGSPQRSYLDQQDLARWLLALFEKGESGRAYNVGSDEAITIADLACLVRDIVAPRKQIRILGKANINAERNFYIPDITRAKNELGLDVRISLAEAIKATAEAAAREH